MLIHITQGFSTWGVSITVVSTIPHIIHRLLLLLLSSLLLGILRCLIHCYANVISVRG